ncbi:MAG: DinB family protein [Chloroflexi bacterium]|nr:DinB family protein [Chloroflexota bacterium]
MTLSYMLSHWEQIRAQLLATIDKFNDEDLTYKPFAESWTVGHLMLHIAYEEEVEMHYGVIQETAVLPHERNADDYPTIAAVKTLLATVHKQTRAYLQTLSEEDLAREIKTPYPGF